MPKHPYDWIGCFVNIAEVSVPGYVSFMDLKKALLSFVLLPLLGGCILPDPEAEAKKAEDEAAATGSGCRQAGRSLEDCYLRNEGLNRTGALRGWRDMDEYMRTNKLDPQPPTPEQVDKELALKDASKEPAKAEAKSEPKAEPKGSKESAAPKH